jgi:hypothetical protein
MFRVPPAIPGMYAPTPSRPKSNRYGSGLKQSFPAGSGWAAVLSGRVTVHYDQFEITTGRSHQGHARAVRSGRKSVKRYRNCY